MSPRTAKDQNDQKDQRERKLLKDHRDWKNGEVPGGSGKTLILIAVCFFFTGASSLILEVTWSKYLSLLLGSTIYGVSTVVAAFMAGLGLGSLVAGSVSSRLRNHIRAYGWLEGIVGVFAILSPLLFTHIDVLFGVLYNLSSQSFALFLFIRFIILFILLMIPTLAMGASLPILVEYFAKREPESKGHIGFFYAVNTVGAVLGTAIAGFYFIPLFGLSRTALLASLLDLGVCAFLLIKAFPIVHPEKASPVKEAERKNWFVKAKGIFLGGDGGTWRSVFISLLFCISGFFAMIYQIGWTRLLIITLGSSVYCFTVILVLYLIGLSIGAASASRWAEKTSAPLAWFGLLEGIIAVTTYLGTFWFEKLPLLTGWAFRSSGGSSAAFYFYEMLIAAPIVLPPTLAMGALFPFAARSYRDVIRKAGRAVGNIYASNTLGTIMGALGAGFLLIPMSGARSSLLAASMGSAVIGIAAIIIARGAMYIRIAVIAISFLAVVGIFIYPPVHMIVDFSDGFISIIRKEQSSLGNQRSSLPSMRVDAQSFASSDVPLARRIIFRREGFNALVSVGADESNRFLFINGKGDASTSRGDMLTQSMLGHLPMIFAPEASDVLVIGFGAGVTTHAVLTYPWVKKVDTVEIESAVIDASRFFNDVNRDVLNDPRHRLFMEDARTWLAYEKGKTYDVIISEPSNPWIAGINNLFTREFYRRVREKLRPGGIFCQWVQTYEISEDSILAILRTLGDAFPDGHVFYLSDGGDMLIVMRKLPFRKPSLEKAFASQDVQQDLAGIGIDEPALLGHLYRATIAHLLSGNEEGVRNTDDNCYVEHRAPLDLIDPTIRTFTIVERKTYFNDFYDLFFPGRSAGQVLVDAGTSAARHDDFDYAAWALQICQDRELTEWAAILRPEVEKARHREEIRERVQMHIRQSRELTRGGNMNKALEELRKAASLDPSDNEVLSDAALILMELNEQKLAEQIFTELIKRGDSNYLYMSHVNMGILLSRQGSYGKSLEEFGKAIDVNPYLGSAYYNGSIVLENEGKIDDAIVYLRRGLRYGYDDPALLKKLASLLEKKGNPGEARSLRNCAKRLAG